MTKGTSQFTRAYLLLEQEGYLFSSCLTAGLTELRAAHVHNKGAFYSALFNLSVGIEHLLKVVVIIDHMLSNQLTIPTRTQLKGYGHNIFELYDRTALIAATQHVAFPTRDTLDDITQDIFGLVNDFAQATRYYNLDTLASTNHREDPLSRWNHILAAIVNRDVSKRQRDLLLQHSKSVAKAMDKIVMTIMHGLDQGALSTEDAIALPGLHSHGAKHAVLRIVVVLYPVRELLSELCHRAYTLSQPSPPFPQMQEFLEWLWNDRAFVLRKKKWP